jgi:anti-sigma B factor antagonist
MAAPKNSHRPSMSPPLDMQVSYRLGAPLVYVKGELDHQTASQLRAVIDEEAASAPSALILELSGVSYMDSGGLSLMFDTLTRMKRSGWLGVVAPTSPVARLMEITGLTDQPGFRVLDDLHAASAALGHPQESI